MLFAAGPSCPRIALARLLVPVAAGRGVHRSAAVAGGLCIYSLGAASLLWLACCFIGREWVTMRNSSGISQAGEATLAQQAGQTRRKKLAAHHLMTAYLPCAGMTRNEQ